MFQKLKSDYGIERITLQTGSTLNAEFLKLRLIDRVQIVVAPILVGGVATPSIIGGPSLLSSNELSKLKAAKLISCKVLANSYVQLEYEVLQDTTIL